MEPTRTWIDLAVVHDRAPVTRNAKHFQRVPEVRIEVPR
jgi:predicted nucleic acid-binding protein